MMAKRGFFFLIFFFFLFCFCQPSTILAQNQLRFPDRLLVKYKEGTDELQKASLRQRFGLLLLDRIDKLGVDVLKPRGGKLEDKLHQLLLLSEIEYVEPDYLAEALETSNDPYLGNQWGLFITQTASASTSAWNTSKSQAEIKIAIVDTGIDLNHEDLQGKVVANHNCTNTMSLNDLAGHGTHVAGIAAAATNNIIGVAGVGYHASLLNAKALDDSGSGYYSWIANCIIWSANEGAKVINLSLGGPYSSKTLEQAVNYAWSQGAVLTAAAGNSGNRSRTYPAYYKNVIAVAATDQNDKKASFSSYGTWVDVAAPGVNIYSTYPGNTYKYANGTSMATPHVAGLAALVWTTPQGSSNLQVRKQIELTADKIPGTGKYWYYGRINAQRAVGGE
jgi:thermitase